MERRRGDLEDLLIDDVTEWCLYNYATGKSDVYIRAAKLKVAHSQAVSGYSINDGLSIIFLYRTGQSLLDSLCSVSSSNDRSPSC